jgi:GST-like protein
LPVGEHPFQLYSLGTPNGQKATIMFEELIEAGHAAEYDAWFIGIGDGDQFGSGFVDINPNSKIPALLDRSGPEPVRVFESGSILVHLAEKFGAFLPTSGPARTETFNWLMWQMGSAPFIGGGFGHFYFYAPRRSNMPSTAMRWRPSACSTWPTAVWPKAASWRAMISPLPISPPSAGSAG